MLERRRMLGTTLLGGLVGATLPSAAEDAGQMSDRQAADITNALKEIRQALEPPQVATEIASLRLKQIEYLKSSNKFPDFIDVGIDVWFAVHDWHIKHLQQLVLGRDGNGRYTIALLSTQLVLRPDAVPSFVSAPYDSR